VVFNCAIPYLSAITAKLNTMQNIVALTVSIKSSLDDHSSVRTGILESSKRVLISEPN